MGVCSSCCEEADKMEKSSLNTDDQRRNLISNEMKKKEPKGKIENNNLINDIDDLIISNDLIIHGIEGTPLEKYSIKKILGEGSYGKVYLVAHKETSMFRAMKQIRHDGIIDSKMVNNEIEIIKKLDYPNILKIYEFFSMNDNIYIITEYCPNGELFKYIVDGFKFTEVHICAIIYQLLLTVYYCHINKIVHRDLKPENLMINGKDKDNHFMIKVIDFGTATIFKKSKMKTKIGSGYYMAPEVLNRSYNEKCDLWSVGVIMYILFSSEAPFRGKNDEETFNQILNKNPDLTKSKFSNVSEEAKDLIIKLLEKDYKKRLCALDALNQPWFKKFIKPEVLSYERLSLFVNNLKQYKSNYKLQQAAIAVIVHNIPSNHEIKELEKAFRVIDENGDGHLIKDELVKGFTKLFRKSPEESKREVDNIFKLVDADKNGVIQYEEFIRACISKEELVNQSNLRFAFNFFDRDQSGTISLDEIKDVFCGSNINIEIKVLEKIISEVDLDKDGQISFEEFQVMMLKIIS